MELFAATGWKQSGNVSRDHEASVQARTGSAWDPTLTRRLRVLLHTAPLHDLRLSDSRRDPDLRHYDSLALALKILDVIIENMGLDREVDRGAVVRSLSPLMRAMDTAVDITPDPTRHAAMVDRLLAGLRNDAEGRHPFAIAYRDIDERGEAVTRQLEFRLVADHFHPSGTVVLRLSNEAINLYLNALELDIEDAQAAAEAVVHSQLARGRFDEAIQSARNARWQSIRFQDKLVGILRDTRRDVARVDWHEEVPRILSDALSHLKFRLDTESAILKTADERLDMLAAGDDRALRVAEVAQLIRECRLRHLDLHDQLMRARNVFLDEQARQAFVPTLPYARPELVSAVLEPVLRLDRIRAMNVLEPAFPGFLGAQPPGIASLLELVLWQLRPRREQSSNDVPVEEADLSTYGADVLRYPAKVREQAEAILASIKTPVTLSEMLELAEAAGAGAAVLELLTLLALHHYAPEEAGSLALRIEKIQNRSLRTDRFFGDELQISPT
jgi:tetratricopeptide (TPR) repeat protein